MSHEFMIRDLIRLNRDNVVEQAKGLLDAGMEDEIAIRDLIRLNRDNVVDEAKGLLNTTHMLKSLIFGHRAADICPKNLKSFSGVHNMS